MNRQAKKQRHLRSLLEVAWCVYITWHIWPLRHLQGSCCKRKIGFSKTWFREWYEALRRLRKAGNFWDHRCKSCQTCLDVGHLVKASATAAGWLRQIITWVKCMNIILVPASFSELLLPSTAQNTSSRLVRYASHIWWHCLQCGNHPLSQTKHKTCKFAMTLLPMRVQIHQFDCSSLPNNAPWPASRACAWHVFFGAP